MRNNLTAAACLASLAIFAVRGEFAVKATSPTFDEAVHLTAGYSYWRTGDFRINRETPPLLKLMWALPLLATDRPPFNPAADQWERNDIWRMGDAFLYESPIPFEAMLYPARRVNLAIGAALVVLVGWWALRLWGRAAGVAAWAIAALDPNLLGQSAVLSTDVGLALFCTATAYALWEYAGISPSPLRGGGRGEGSWARPTKSSPPTPLPEKGRGEPSHTRRAWFIVAGVSLGLALATKYSAGVAVVGCGLGAIAFVLASGQFALPGESPRTVLRERLGRTLPAFVRLGLIAAIAILPAYFVVQFLDWPRGLRLQLGRNEFEPPHYYLNGEISTQGWWWYFPEVIALKTPAGTLILAVVSLLAGVAARRFTRRDIAFLLVPAAVFFLGMAAARINIGLRVILPAYPLLWLLAARVASFGATTVHKTIAVFVVATGIVVPLAIDGDLFGKRSISYFNGIVVGRADAHRYLGDSNLDWGQGLQSLRDAQLAGRYPVIFLSYSGTARPEAHGIAYEQLPGWSQFRAPLADRVQLTGPIIVAVSVSNFQGTYMRDPTMYRWLLERPPISRTDESIWLWDLTGDVEAIEKLTDLGRQR